MKLTIFLLLFIGFGVLALSFFFSKDLAIQELKTDYFKVKTIDPREANPGKG